MKQLTACIVTALLLSLAFAPFYQGYLGFFAMIPLFFCFADSWKLRFLTGWGAGFLMQATGYYWIFNTIRDFGGQSTAISLVGGTLFWLYQGLDLALWLTLAPILARHAHPILRAALAAGLWFWLQTSLFPYVFPWQYGGAFTSLAPVSHAAAFWSAYGLGFLAVWLQGNAVLYPRRGLAPWKVACALLGPLLLLFAGLGFRHETEREIWRVVVVQPNLIPWAKRGHVGVDELFEAHYRPTLEILSDQPDLILWPESALAFNLRNYPEYQERLRALADQTGAAIVTGTLGAPDRQSYYNEIWMFAPGAGQPQIYQKEKLVLFSESLPRVLSWARYFDSALGGFRPGEKNRAFRFRDKKLVPLVCFEALFPDYVRQRQGHLMLNLTNDAWFGETKASWQHLQQIQLRAVENGVPLVRATNSGISCWVDVDGRVKKPGHLYTRETHLYQVPVPLELPRGFSHIGEGLVRWGTLLALVYFFAAGVRGRLTRARAGGP